MKEWPVSYNAMRGPLVHIGVGDICVFAKHRKSGYGYGALAKNLHSMRKKELYQKVIEYFQTAMPVAETEPRCRQSRLNC